MLEDILSALDVLVQPSIIREGLPLVLAEGASAGLPLIASICGWKCGNCQRPGKWFLVVQRDAFGLAEKIKFRSQNPDEAKRMGENSRRIWQDKSAQR